MLGYACINTALQDKNFRFRTFRKANFTIQKLQEIALHNLKVTKRILEWNKEHDIYMYRMSSNLIPFMNVPEIGMRKELWMLTEFRKMAYDIGNYVEKNNMRISMHPSHFTSLTSIDSDVRGNSLRDIEMHGLLMRNVNAKDMILHLGGRGSDKSKSKSLAKGLLNSSNYRDLIRLENDKTWTIEELEDMEYPVVFDVLHHRYTHRCELEDIKTLVDGIKSTWDTKPKIHLSQGKEGTFDYAHSDYIDAVYFEEVRKIFKDFDIMLECKMKEQAVLRLQ